MDAQSSDASDSSNSNDVIDTISAMLVDGLIPGASPNVDDYDVDKPRRVRAPNKARLFEHGEKEFVRKYFCENAVYDEADFERRFRMPRSVFKRIVHGLSGRGLFVQRRDAIKKEGIKPLLRIIASMRILAYGKSFDEVDEICEMSRTSIRQSFKFFVRETISVFSDEYLRAPNETDLRRILGINSQRGFPGCLGSWDCQHWEWKNCPVAWAGQFKGKEKKPTIVLEAVADAELWIWACHVGKPGSMNDLNILDSSPIVTSILEGRLLPQFEYSLNGRKRVHPYFLVDGIYPPWSIFVSTISEPSSKKEKLFGSAQEGIRKDVERAFGVLVSRWSLLSKPCATWDRVFAADVMKCGIIIHNMIVEARRDGYNSEFFSLASDAADKGFFIDENGNEKEFQWNTYESLCESSNTLRQTQWERHITKTNARVKDDVLHHALKLDLIEHIWAEYGNE